MPRKTENPEKVTLTDALGNSMLTFRSEGRNWSIRQPLPEEYDDAMSLQTMTYRKVLQQPHVQAVANMPCSEGERALLEGMISLTERRFREAEDGPQKDDLAQELARLQNDLTSRTLAQETASDRAALTRDRWLCMRLLCDENGKAIFDTSATDFEEKWNKFPIKIKDDARPAIWRALTLVREAPFSLDL